ncbi:MAG: response regulator transcription factor [Dehalococcoidia bacterium]
MITILIADDNRMVRQGLRSLLEDEGDILIAGEASTGLEAIQWVRSTPVDVVLMDIRMPGLDGITATTQIMQIRPEVKVLVLTIVDESGTLARAIAAGAHGCLVYDRLTPETLPEHIRAIVRDSSVTMPPSVAESLIRHNDFRRALTRREKEILNLIAEGKTNREIGEIISVQEKTVKVHIRNLYAKLGIKSRYQAIRLGLDDGFDHDG